MNYLSIIGLSKHKNLTTLPILHPLPCILSVITAPQDSNEEISIFFPSLPILVWTSCNLQTSSQFLTLGCCGIFNLLQRISSVLMFLRVFYSLPSTAPNLCADTQRPGSLAMLAHPCKDIDTQLYLFSTPSLPRAFLLFLHHLSDVYY